MRGIFSFYILMKWRECHILNNNLYIYASSVHEAENNNDLNNTHVINLQATLKQLAHINKY